MRRGTGGRLAVSIGSVVLIIIWTLQHADATPGIVVGPFQTVFNHSSQACDPDDFPDTAARAFRDNQGNIQVIVINSISSHRLISKTLSPSNATMHRDCDQPLIVSAHNDDPAMFDDQLWIQGVYTFDGKTIYAIIHDEFHGEKRPNLCPSQEMDQCWYCTLLGAVSTDAGKTYTLYPLEERVVAALPQTYPQGIGNRVGLSQNTGIIHSPKDNMFYFMAERSASLYGDDVDRHHRRSDVAPNGMCLFRTANITDPTSWYAWNGHDFGAKMVNPYTLNKTGGDPREHVCQIIPQRMTSLRFSLYYSTFYEQFMLVGACYCDLSKKESPSCVSEGSELRGHEGSPYSQEAFCFALSDDLITWGDLYYVMNVTSIQTWGEHHDDGTTGQWYPAFLDPNVEGYNFDKIGETAYLFFVYYHPKIKNYGKSRDVWRAAVKFTKT